MPVSLVLPCYNPQPGWEEVVHAGYLSFAGHIDTEAELILVLDGKSNTVQTGAVEKLQRLIPSLKVISYEQNRGKGYATRKGVAAASGDIIIYTDVDFPYSAESIYAVYDQLQNNECDVAAGVKNDAYYDHVPVMRRVISRVLRFFIRLFLAMPITDTQCGLKGFRRTAAATFLSTNIDRYLFDLQFIYSCFRNKQLRVKAIPVTLKDNVRFRSMNYRILLPEMLNFARLLFTKNR
jgi:glycosyltransferase involved in cell wall biosynthesis